MDFSGNDNSLPPQPFDVSDSHLIRNELGTAQRLKRRWTLGLGMVGAVALVSLALVIAMAVKGTETKSADAPTTLKLRAGEHESSSWSWWEHIGQKDDDYSLSNATSELGNKSVKWTEVDSVQFQREDALSKRLAETEQRVKMLEEKLALLESKASETDNADRRTGHNDESVNALRELKQHLDEFQRNVTVAEAETLRRLVALESAQEAANNQSNDMKELLQDFQRRQKRAKENSNASLGNVTARVDALSKELNSCLSHLQDLAEKVNETDGLLEELSSVDASDANNESLDAMLNRIAEQERKMETAYSELKAQTEAAIRSQASSDAAQNRQLEDIKGKFDKVWQKAVALESNIQSVANAKGKCLVGRVSAPFCDIEGDCWPYQTTVTFPSIFQTEPKVVAALSKVDTYTDENRGFVRRSKDNVVLTITASSVTTSSFILKVYGGKSGGGNNHLFDADVSWIACA